MNIDKPSQSPKFLAHSVVGSAVRGSRRTKAPSPTVVRTGRGLTIAGTRTTLYGVMDYLKAEWPPELIREWLDLTEEQLTGVMDYIEKHREQVEAEYETVLRQADENRRYWGERDRDRSANETALPMKPGQEEIRAKLANWKKKLNAA